MHDQSSPSRSELEAALADPNANNPLARALADALARYARQLEAASTRAGGWPNPLVLSAPTTEVEAFAVELLTNELTAAGVRVTLKGDS